MNDDFVTRLAGATDAAIEQAADELAVETGISQSHAAEIMRMRIYTAWMGINHCLPCAAAVNINLDMKAESGEVHCAAS
ncbi:MAG: hypothetical protein COS35_07455 [Zetaproteobacteria bacterium CG02_land_8_20_14_3_00_50_9]|nr:MAG: hypothetical protein AUJ57_12145 [Zetaproteobacteria bacterium CG1_02_53_45]PIQ33372.1 MAG: hypothetical protein COW62_05505 [Zetaproteobacteria bacterium CG17_big_fil_post_rev_8_21_14_2_50_50_13]PIV30305.1 MAG: hypothetical protein COS35_07455 [Zetaproteobacteria bacterium CG02_land_8_20_14_3_00_50_9]PIY57012.1 MAG: hypothetical protein COZ00_01170 [Zetaproteobacteria bacterium CG_4_10_14_0_8_um_filter_49_80]